MGGLQLSRGDHEGLCGADHTHSLSLGWLLVGGVAEGLGPQVHPLYSSPRVSWTLVLGLEQIPSAAQGGGRACWGFLGWAGWGVG